MKGSPIASPLLDSSASSTLLLPYVGLICQYLPILEANQMELPQRFYGDIL